MSTVYRGDMTVLWVTLQASEELGLLSSDYVQDYFGNDGQVTLHHIDSAADFPVVMVDVPLTTPEIPHDVFTGSYSLALLQDGDYEIRGRVRDIAGNYTILNSVQVPLGGETVQPLLMTLLSGFSNKFVVRAGGAVFRTGFDSGISFGVPAISGGDLFNYEIVSGADL